MNQDTFDVAILDPAVIKEKDRDSVLSKSRTILWFAQDDSLMKEAFGPNVYGYCTPEDDAEYFRKKFRICSHAALGYKSVELMIRHGSMKVQYDDIFRITLESRKLILYCRNERIPLRYVPLQEIYEKFEGHLLYVNRSSLVNPLHIKKLDKNKIIMDDGSEEYVSRQTRKDFLHNFERWRIEH